MTRRERMEQRAEKRREWAEGRRSKATALRKVDEHIRHDWAFITQPGHIPARARMNARDERAYEHGKVAAHHDSKAAGIEAALERTIFSDDPDATDALRVRIAELEAKREQMKRTNAAFRKGDEAFAAVLGCTVEQATAQRARIVDPANLSWHRVPFAAYELQNLGGNITRLRKRLVDVEGRRERTAKAEAAPDGVLVERVDDYARVTFPEKPERDVLDALRGAGFRWGAGCWVGRFDALPACVQGGAA